MIKGKYLLYLAGILVACFVIFGVYALINMESKTVKGNCYDRRGHVINEVTCNSQELSIAGISDEMNKYLGMSAPIGFLVIFLLIVFGSMISIMEDDKSRRNRIRIRFASSESSEGGSDNE